MSHREKIPFPLEGGIKCPFGRDCGPFFSRRTLSDHYTHHHSRPEERTPIVGDRQVAARAAPCGKCGKCFCDNMWFWNHTCIDGRKPCSRRPAASSTRTTNGQTHARSTGKTVRPPLRQNGLLSRSTPAQQPSLESSSSSSAHHTHTPEPHLTTSTLHTAPQPHRPHRPPTNRFAGLEEETSDSEDEHLIDEIFARPAATRNARTTTSNRITRARSGSFERPRTTDSTASTPLSQLTTTQHSATLPSVTQHSTSQHNSTQHSATQGDSQLSLTQHSESVTQHSATQDSTTQHTPQHTATQHSSTQLSVTQHNPSQHSSDSHSSSQSNGPLAADTVAVLPPLGIDITQHSDTAPSDDDPPERIFDRYDTAEGALAGVRSFHRCPLKPQHFREVYRGELRELTINLMDTIAEPPPDMTPILRSGITTAFHLIPSIIEHLILEKSKTKPKAFLESALAEDCPANRVLDEAGRLLDFVEKGRQNIKNRRNKPLSFQGTCTTIAKQIEKCAAEDRFGAATVKLEDGTKFIANPNRAAPAPLTLQQVCVHTAALNPPARDRDRLPSKEEQPDDELAEAPVIKKDVFLDVLQDLNKQSAEGPSGWTFALIHWLFAEYYADQSHDHSVILKFLNAMLKGEIDRDFWTDSRCVLIPKGEDAYRPIGIGDVWYRLLGKCVMRTVATSVAAKLKPFQLGCGVSGGAEIGARLAQVFLDHLEDHVLIKTDLKNAYNVMPHDIVFEALLPYCPELQRNFRYSYGAPSPLWDKLGNLVGTNATGCRQGDPLSPLFFCVGIHKTITDIQDMIHEVHKAHFPDYTPPPTQGNGGIDVRAGIVLAYMDDITISVHKDIAAEVCRRLGAIFDKVDLELNVGKCRVIGPNVRDIQEELPFARREEGDIILGCPVGTLAYRTATCREMMKERSACLPTMDKLRLSSSTSFNIAKVAVNARLTYLIRALGRLGLDIAPEFDGDMDNALFRIPEHNPDQSALPADMCRRKLSALMRSLPLELGGLGVIRHSWLPGQVQALKAHKLLVDFAAQYMPQFICTAIDDIQTNPDTRVVLGAHNPLDFHTSPLFGGAVTDTQVSDSDRTPEDQAQSHYNNTSFALKVFLVEKGDLARAAMYRTECYPGSGRWLATGHKTQQNPNTRYSHEVYRTALQKRLLVAPLEDYPHPDRLSLCRCGPEYSISEPTHLLNCREHKDGALTHRHTICQEIVTAALKLHAKEKPIIENRPIMHLHDGTETQIFADLKVIVPTVCERVLDFTVTDPAGSQHLTPVEGVSSAHATRFASNQAEEKKRRKYRHTQELRDGTFVPFAVEASGLLGVEARNYLLTVLDHPEHAKRRGIPHPIIKVQARLGSAMAKASAEAINLRVHRMLAQTMVHHTNQQRNP